MDHDILILGGGPAGLAAGVAARGRDKKVLVISNPWRESPLAKAEILPLSLVRITIRLSYSPIGAADSTMPVTVI